MIFSKAKEEPATEKKTEIETMQAELADMKRKEKLRQKYGALCTDEQLAFYQAEEDKVAAGKKLRKEGDERGRIAAQKQKEAIETAAHDLLESGRILLTVDGVRVTSVGESLYAQCPHCGGRADTSDVLFHFAELWTTTPKDQMWSPFTGMHIPSARNPLSPYCGFPAYINGGNCRDCKKQSMIICQLVVL